MTELTPPTSQESAFHGQSVSLVRAKPAHQALFPYFLVALGTLLVVGIAGYWWMNSTMKAELDAKKLDYALEQQTKAHTLAMDALKQEAERQQDEIRRAAAAELENERRAQQKAEHAQLVQLVESGQKQLDAFIAAQRAHDELLTSNGREIAARDELLTKYEIIERQHPAPVFEPAAVRTLLTSVAARGNELAAQASVASGPSAELKQSVDTAIAETNAALKSQIASNQALGALVAEAAADGTPAADVDIKDALALRVQRAEQARLQALAEAEEAGRKDAEERLRALAEQKVREGTDIQLAAATRAFDQQQATIKRVNEELYAAQVAKDEELIRIKRAELDKEIARLHGEAGLAEAEVHVTEASAAAKKSEKELEAERIAQEAEKKRLREKAKSPEVAAALAPFFGSGTWQPPAAKVKPIDPGPISLSALRSEGALNATRAGLHRLFLMGASPGNDRPGKWSEKDRSLGKGEDVWFKNKPEAVATARKAQDLLNELGPTLVELGLLAP